ncbi:DUF305 domain-containing protein [Actinomadura rupiterrae]|uniref:DUF305 domain-containing protein n=1 Tax=Actinomadura rupiterrae TaxID=559627 RepID=UPI0020A24055|nr:DUF305 domain-containing protein [Actinomadura rupiterrae]MCP2336899.1 uncharacterized protein (DUF305 family) [Actinomadura rupiterrae]
MNKQRIAAAGMAVVLGLSAAACGGNDKKDDKAMSGHEGMSMPSATAPASQGGHNAQDVMFAQMMIPHHRQAVVMAKTVLAKGSDPKVKNLAGRIEKAQAPEIEKMSGWLKAWGESVPAEGGGHSMPGMDHPMPGMMTEKQMAAFEKASGKDIDRMFLTMMIEHHKGAVTMAEQERKSGASAEAKALAGDIIKAQQAEITEMGGLAKS